MEKIGYIQAKLTSITYQDLKIGYWDETVGGVRNDSKFLLLTHMQMRNMGQY